MGLGAMGGGMARSLLTAPDIDQVTGFDLSPELVETFYNDAKAANKAPPSLPEKLELANYVDGTTDVVVIVLVNERKPYSPTRRPNLVHNEATYDSCARAWLWD